MPLPGRAGLLLCCAAGLLVACGDDASESSTRGRFRTQPEPTATALLTRLAEGDLAGARDFFQPAAWVNFENNLDLFRKNFADADEGPRVKAELESRIGRLSPEQWRDLEAAGPAELWSLWIRAYPMPVPPKLRGIGVVPREPAVRRVVFQGPVEQSRHMELVQVRELWFVRDIQLP